MSRREGTRDPGGLYIVATPIGNMADITFRAVDVLKSVDMVAAEDTRHTKHLLSHYGIRTRLVSCHEHNESRRAAFLVEKIKQGASIALVSDAGTPSVSDPGYRLLRAAIEAGIRIIPVPGVSAAMAAVSVSGLPSDRFCFVGFLPKKESRRRQILQSLADAEGTLIFYESPRRLWSLLQTLLRHLGDRQAVVAREMTKQHEEFIRGGLAEVAAEIEQRQAVRGEITVLVSGKTPEFTDAGQIPEALRRRISTEAAADVSASRLASELAGKYRMPKRRVYRLILEERKSRSGP